MDQSNWRTETIIEDKTTFDDLDARENDPWDDKWPPAQTFGAHCARSPSTGVWTFGMTIGWNRPRRWWQPRLEVNFGPFFGGIGWFF